MDRQYRDAIAEASAILAQAMLEDANELIEDGRKLDLKVKSVLWRLGCVLVQTLFRHLQRQLVEEAKQKGFTVERRPKVCFKILFGPIWIESVYMYDRAAKQGYRPLREHFGVVGRSYSDGVERALTDFGIEKSFGRAATQFEEHYGWEVGRTTVLRLTENLGERAEEYLQQRFKQGEERYLTADAAAPKANCVVTSLDGCMIRTGKLMTAQQAADQAEDDAEADHYGSLEPDKVVRPEAWKEVRTGLARKQGQVEPTFVCRRGSYAEVCRQLFGAAGLEGLGFDTKVIGLIDGAFGLKEAMEMSFADLQIILDPSHLKHHFWETSKVLGHSEEAGQQWIDAHFERLAHGHSLKVVAELQSERVDHENGGDKQAAERMDRLIEYLRRFMNCVHYKKYRAEDWPIGSGEAEAAHRYIPQERLKITGACWREETLNPMLALRVARANGWWDDFWQNEHAARAA